MVLRHALQVGARAKRAPSARDDRDVHLIVHLGFNERPAQLVEEVDI